MGAMLRILEVLTAAQIEHLESFCRERARTIDEVHGFVADLIQAKGEVSRNAVWNWKKEFDERAMRERFSRSGELARAMKDAFTQGDVEAVFDATVMNFAQKLFEISAQMQVDGEFDSESLQRCTRALKDLVGSKEAIVKMLFAKFERETKKVLDASPERKVTAEQIEAVGKRIFGS